MAGDGKALLAFGKALPGCESTSDNQAMLSTAEALKQKLAAVLAGGLSQAAIAKACKVSKQAVQGWKNTGRIDKKHLPGLAAVSGKPLAWWLDYSTDSSSENTPPPPPPAPQPSAQEITHRYKATRWPFASIEPDEYALLSNEQHTLVEGFVRGLLAEAKRNKSTPAPRAA